MRSKGMSGKPIGARAAYGYKKDDKDKNKWIIDPVSSKVVKKIFMVIKKGYGISSVAHKLEEDKVLYATNFSANYTGSNLQKDTTSLSCSVGTLTTYGSIGTGTPYSPTYTGAAQTRWAAQVYNVVTTDNIKYEQMI